MYRDQVIEFNPQMNLITGNDGSGKESLIKAIEPFCSPVQHKKQEETLHRVANIYGNVYELDDNIITYMKCINSILSANANDTVILKNIDGLDHNLKEDIFEVIETRNDIQIIIVSNHHWIINAIPNSQWIIMDKGVVIEKTHPIFGGKPRDKAFLDLVNFLDVHSDIME